VSNLLTHPVKLFAMAAGTCVLAMGAALHTQHVMGMEPCPWCVLQRLIFVGIFAFAVLGMAWRRRLGVMVAALGMDLLAALGVAAALWQHFVASSSNSCNLTFADRFMSATGLDGLLPDVFAARASCAEAATTLVGVPYEFWSLATFAMVGTLAVLALLSQMRAAR
jgi:disulfide bond formation protein DsbB